MVEGSRKRFMFPNETLEPAQTAGIRILSGSDTNQTFEGPLKVIRADSDLLPRARRASNCPSHGPRRGDRCAAPSPGDDPLWPLLGADSDDTIGTPRVLLPPESQRRVPGFDVAGGPDRMGGSISRWTGLRIQTLRHGRHLWSRRLPKGFLHRQRLVRGFVSSRLDPGGRVALDNHQRNVIRRPPCGGEP